MPRLTSACGSPWVATTCPSLTATLTPQPTPQKRQGAFDHLRLAASALVTAFCAWTGSAMPAAAAAEDNMNSRRVMSGVMDRPRLGRFGEIMQAACRRIAQRKTLNRRVLAAAHFFAFICA